MPRIDPDDFDVKPDPDDTSMQRALLEVSSADVRQSLEEAYGLMQEALDKGGAPDEILKSVGAAISVLESAVIKVERLEDRAEKALVLTESLSAANRALKQQRDEALQQAEESFEAGIEHAYECEQCMEDAEIGHIAEQIFESDPYTVAEEMRAELERKLSEAQALYQEMFGYDLKPDGTPVDHSSEPHFMEVTPEDEEEEG